MGRPDDQDLPGRPLVVRLEDDDRVALAAQEMRRPEAGRPAADHRDLLAGEGRGRGQGDPVLDRPVADILLDRVDADEVVDLVAIAAVLAGRRADAAHDRGKRIGLDHAVEGVVLPRHAGDRRLVHAARDGEPAADVVARWATALAGRRAMDVSRALVGYSDFENRLPRGRTYVRNGSSVRDFRTRPCPKRFERSSGPQ